MKDVIGEIVKHDCFGKGHVTGFDDKHIEVLFDIGNASKVFALSSIGYHLYFEDDSLTEELKPNDNVEGKRSTVSKKTGMQKMDELIGLQGPKEAIMKVLNFYEMRKYAAMCGVDIKPINLTFVFSGNPGSCKTSFASIFAQALYEKKIIKGNDVQIVSRASIVGKYSGHTAALVKEKFEEAHKNGNVLVIDEAYALSSSKEDGYGTECINEITNQLEIFAGEICVIFAGYPEPMKQFIAKNEGLFSRVNFFLDFPDYSADELLEIADYIAKDKGCSIADSAKAMLLRSFATASKIPNFGNGRFSRQTVERAQMNMAGRIVAGRKDNLTKDSFMLLPQDFNFLLESAA